MGESSITFEPLLTSHNAADALQVVCVYLGAVALVVLSGLGCMYGTWLAIRWFLLLTVPGAVPAGSSSDDDLWESSFSSDAEYKEFMSSGMTLGEWDARGEWARRQAHVNISPDEEQIFDFGKDGG